MQASDLMLMQGIPFVSGLALQNCRDLLPILKWNVEHGIHFMRCASAVNGSRSQRALVVSTCRWRMSDLIVSIARRAEHPCCVLFRV